MNEISVQMENKEENKVKDKESVEGMILKADECDDKDGVDGGDPDSDPGCTSDKLFEADQLHFCSLLPQEIWLFILDMLKDSPEDMESCAKASPYFRELLWDQRVLFLFPKVLNILIPLHEPIKWQMTRMTGKNVGDANTQPEVNQAVPLDADTVSAKKEELRKWRNSLLTCRQVCRSWNLSVEQCYEKPKNQFSINSALEAQNLIQHFENSHHSAQNPKNPFYRRYLTIGLQDYVHGYDRQGNLLNIISRLLRIFGHEVHHLVITEAYSSGNEELYLKFKEWFELMPNLRVMRLWSTYSGELSQEFIGGNPLPKLENLQELFVGVHSGGSIVSELIRKNYHIQTLTFWDPDQFDPEVGSLLSNLTDFRFYFSKNAEEMVKRFGSSWKLKKVELFGQLKEVLQLSENKWKDTLTELKLHLYSGYNCKETLENFKNLRLSFPHLRQLHIQVQGYIFLDFILPLAKNLEYLEIDCRDPENRVNVNSEERRVRDNMAQSQVIQFAGFERKMQESNIWKIFTKLQKIKVEFGGANIYQEYFLFTRKGEKLFYERQKE